MQQSLLRPPTAVPLAHRPHTADTRAKVTCAMLTAAEADLLQQPSRRSGMVNAGACKARCSSWPDACPALDSGRLPVQSSLSHASPRFSELRLPRAPGLTSHTEGSAARPSTAASVSIPRRGHSLSNINPGSPSKATRQAAWGSNEQEEVRSPPERSVANRDRTCAEPPALAARVPTASWGNQQQVRVRVGVGVRVRVGVGARVRVRVRVSDVHPSAALP